MTIAADLIRTQIHDLEHTIADAERADQQSIAALDALRAQIAERYRAEVAAARERRDAALKNARRDALGADIPALKAEHRRLTKVLALLDPDSVKVACPECGAKVMPGAGLGAHRQKVHGIAGTTTKPKPKAAPAKPAGPTHVVRGEGPGFVGTVNYAEVARVATEAARAGKAMVAAVVEHYGISKGAAERRIMAARTRGFDIPRVRTKVEPVTRRPAAPGQPTANLDAVRDVLAKADAAS